MFAGVDFGEMPPVPPFVTFEDRLNVYVGDLELQVFHVGPAHTNNDVVVWVEQRKTLFAGDIIFKDCTPFAQMGSLREFFPTLDRLRALGVERVVPGHGPVCGPEVFDETEEYLRFLEATARQGFGAGLSPLDLARQTDLSKFANLHDSERIVQNLHRAYSELRGEPLAAPLDYPTIRREAEAWAGHPLRCYA
jgi:cyclase